jgi:hypothetical protein
VPYVPPRGAPIPLCMSTHLHMHHTEVIHPPLFPPRFPPPPPPAHRAFTGRDLSWLTWDCWYVIFREAYGPPGDDEYLQLASEPPEDYTPPPGQFAQPGEFIGGTHSKQTRQGTILSCSHAVSCLWNNLLVGKGDKPCGGLGCKQTVCTLAMLCIASPLPFLPPCLTPPPHPHTHPVPPCS